MWASKLVSEHAAKKHGNYHVLSPRTQSIDQYNLVYPPISMLYYTNETIFDFFFSLILSRISKILCGEYFMFCKGQSWTQTTVSLTVAFRFA